jgi:hypothetical protein
MKTKHEIRDLKESELLLEIQKRLERNETAHRADLVNRYTSEDLVKAWTAGFLAGEGVVEDKEEIVQEEEERL